MANQVKKLASGSELEVQVASFEKAHALLQASRLTGIPVDNVLDLLLTPPVQEALWPCMGVCLYNKQKITKDTFDSEGAREDYLVVAKDVFSANVLPFYKSLASKSETRPPETK